MKHAGSQALKNIAGLLEDLRERARLRERTEGVFYLGSKAFLHFHEDPTGTFADLRSGVGFVRHPVNCAKEWRALLKEVDTILDDGCR